MMNQPCLKEESRPYRFDSVVPNGPVYKQRVVQMPSESVTTWSAPNGIWQDYNQINVATYIFIKFKNRSLARFGNARFDENPLIPRPKKTAPPSWLLKRMEALRLLPPPTLKEVETSFRSAEEARQKYVPSRTNYTNGRKGTSAY